METELCYKKSSISRMGKVGDLLCVNGNINTKNYGLYLYVIAKLFTTRRCANITLYNTISKLRTTRLRANATSHKLPSRFHTTRCHANKTIYNTPLNWYNFAQHTFTLMQFHILYAGKFSLPFNFRPFRPCCEWPNLRLDEFEFLSSNTTVSGQIQDRENPFATEEGQT